MPQRHAESEQRILGQAKKTFDAKNALLAFTSQMPSEAGGSISRDSKKPLRRFPTEQLPALEDAQQRVNTYFEKPQDSLSNVAVYGTGEPLDTSGFYQPKTKDLALSGATVQGLINNDSRTEASISPELFSGMENLNPNVTTDPTNTAQGVATHELVHRYIDEMKPSPWTIMRVLALKRAFTSPFFNSHRYNGPKTEAASVLSHQLEAEHLGIHP